MANIGQIIDDKYEILTLIGQGGMSKVYLARDRRLNKQWAVKEIQKKARDKNNEVVVQSAIAEANMIKQLDHPSIVRIVDIIDEPDVIYIIEDYIEGETLNTLLEDQGAQPQELVIEWAMQICEAFEYLHTRKPPIIYRDMKPSNVMVRPDGNIKIIDFGIAREYKEQSSADTVSLGTKGYAAPEQFGGKGQTDARTDIYCLGVTLYHLVTGQSPCDPPYEIYPIRHWNPQLDPGLEAIIEKCTQLNPGDRYQSCAELLYALQHYEENGAEYRARQKKKLNTFIGPVAAMLVFLMVGVLGLVMQSKTNDKDYGLHLIEAENATTSIEKAQSYAKAIAIKPLETEAYAGMVDAFNDDGAFTEDEEQILKDTINPRLTQLREQGDYAQLAFDIGKLYWYYYDYGKTNGSDNDETRTKNAISWFRDSIEYGGTDTEFYTMASVYSEIGEFDRDIEAKSMEGTDKGEYKKYWGNIENLVEMMTSSDDENEIVQLEVYRLAINSIEIYGRKFRNDGIKQNEMKALYKSVEEAVEKVEVVQDSKQEELKNEVVGRLSSAEEAIENAYKG